MKIKIWIFFITCLCFLTGCSLGQKEQFNQYLIEHKYKLPFVFKNENANGGKEKFLISTEEDYESRVRMNYK